MTPHGQDQLPSGGVCSEPASVPSPTGTGRRVAFVGAIGAAVLALAFTSCGGGPSGNGTHPLSSSVLAQLNTAVHEEVSGNDARAVADFLAVVKTDPHNQIAWYNLGVIADRNGQTNTAVSDYRTALVGDAHYVPALYNLAVLEAPAHLAQAAELYQQVVRLQPKMATAHLNLGLALESLGQRAAGKAQIAAALALDPALASRVPPGPGAG